MSEILTTKETVSILRKALKTTFPNVKFSVRTSKGSLHSAVRVDWRDGPTVAEVEAVADGYSGQGFDGMIDLSYCQDSWLAPDGRAYFAGTEGTTGSQGSVPSRQEPAPVPGCRRVRFSLGSVFCTRTYSRKAIDTVLAGLTEKGAPNGVYTIRGSDDWGFNLDTNAQGFDDWLYWRNAAHKAIPEYKPGKEEIAAA